MTLDPILMSTPIIQAHTLAACVAFVLGPIALLRRSRDRIHRLAGYGWVIAMALTALTALGIFELRVIGPLSPIHGLSGLVAVMLWLGLRDIRAGRVVAHGRRMVQLHIWTMGIAGLFTLLPGRRMSQVLLSETGWPGFAAAALIFALGAGIMWRAQPRLPSRADSRTGRNFPLFKRGSLR